MAATPCPGRSGCRCPYCWGIREVMRELTGKTYGLPVTYVPFTVPVRPVEAPVSLVPRASAPQPWEPRPARRRAA